jgi:hypothetical protein
MIEWNYYVKRFERHCLLHNLFCEKPHLNIVLDFHGIAVFLMVWKFRPRYFFSFTPDFKEIDQLIQSNQI